MSRHNYKKRLKYVFLAFACATAFTFSGLATACTGDDASTEDKEKTTTKEDTQVLKNGNFEFFTIPEKKEKGNEPEYLIKSVESWSHGGTNSYSMSGIVSTTKTAWNKLSADGLADDLDYNNKLDSSASDYLSNYVDYNGMKSTDILYRNQYDALKSEEDWTDDEKHGDAYLDRKSKIVNPETHYNVKEKDGKLYTDGGNGREVFENDKGEYFLKYDKGEYSEPISNVLMLHNYATSHNGIAQSYSSVEIDLPANTAAEISVWVKTAYLLYGKGEQVTQDRGANISLTQTVGSSSLDKFEISCINTEKLIKEGAENSNGWIKYTVYVNACDFASSKIKLELGLGETSYLTEGYAFFDDATVTKYSSLEDSENYLADEDKLYDEDKDANYPRNTCNLSSDASEKIFKADSYVRNVGMANEINKSRNSKEFCYRLDLASEYGSNRYTPVSFKALSSVDGTSGKADLKAGYTVDKNNYVSTLDSDYPVSAVNLQGLTAQNLSKNEKPDEVKWRKPFESSINTSDDLLAVTNANASPISVSKYADKLNEALKNASNLPQNDENGDMLVMLSAYGAAYTASFPLSVPREGYRIVSFWVKTSDMSGSTAATLSVKSNDDNVAKFTLDTTGNKTDIGDEKDIYDGWVQCFFFIKNELEAEGEKTEDTVTVEFSLGNTTIKDSAVHTYKNGWVALANMRTLDVSEEIFKYTNSSGSTTAALTISEEEDKTTKSLDDAYSTREIKDDIATPSVYKGVNGGSAAIVNREYVSIPFDNFNNTADANGNKFTGLVNRKYFENYAGESWYSALLANFNKSGLSASEAWTEIFGDKCTQPIVINNVTRNGYVAIKGATEDTYADYYIKDKDTGAFKKVSDVPDAKFDENETYYSLKQVMNYGYIGANKDVSSDSYATISVRVKASANAIAYVYLVDTTAGKKILSYSAPSYSFYYDAEGNALKAKPKDNATNKEQRENILYTLRNDGLYEDKDGKPYANVYNYAKLYYDEGIVYYDKPDGNDRVAYNIDKLEQGKTYYTEAGKEANHYLVTNGGVKIYQYLDGNYYYIVSGKTQSEVITPFDVSYARYDLSGVSEDYKVKIVGNDHLINGVPQWVTVTFVIHAGNATKSYRLELWSGERDSLFTDGNGENGTVIFDYSYDTVSDDSEKSDYEKEIINEYLKAIPDEVLAKLETTGGNIRDYEELIEKNKADISADDLAKLNQIKDGYTAHYYTYSLYDSADFRPFNKEVASDGATGYDYNVSDQSETLAYLKLNDENSYKIFADYSAVDKSVSLNNPTADDETEDDKTTETDSTDGSIWLLASSIILVVALMFAIIAIFAKDALKKMRRNKVTSNNAYDHRKTNRYKRKLRLQSENVIEVDEPADNFDEPVEDVAESSADEASNESEAEVENPDDGQEQ